MAQSARHLLSLGIPTARSRLCVLKSDSDAYRTFGVAVYSEMEPNASGDMGQASLDARRCR